MKRLLMIAYQFPPFAVSSGIQRTLGFARHLPEFGWEPLVLTAHPRAYSHRSDEHLEGGDSQIIVERAFALDAAIHLSVAGRYPGPLARPDRWISWWLGAVPKGLAMIRRYRPHAIWSTYPIATAHKIAGTLHRFSRLPWIADFRDPMAQDGYPEDPKVWRSFKRIEEGALHSASRSVFVTSGAAQMYRERYPHLTKSRISVIENGYDEEAFDALEASVPSTAPRTDGMLTLLHSGVVYPTERDPTRLFQAVRRLMDAGVLTPRKLRIRLRAAGHEAFLEGLIRAAGVDQIVELAPQLPYRQALREMMSVDALVVLQGASCNQQVPAKLYEYLRCDKPVLGLTDPQGDTAGVLRRAGLDAIARLDSTEDIARVLPAFLRQLREGTARLPEQRYVQEASRLHRTAELAQLLDGMDENRIARAPVEDRSMMRIEA